MGLPEISQVHVHVVPGHLGTSRTVCGSPGHPSTSPSWSAHTHTHPPTLTHVFCSLLVVSMSMLSCRLVMIGNTCCALEHSPSHMAARLRAFSRRALVVSCSLHTVANFWNKDGDMPVFTPSNHSTQNSSHERNGIQLLITSSIYITSTIT